MIPFSKTQIQDLDSDFIIESLSTEKIEGGGIFYEKALDLLRDEGFNNHLLTTSCTSALEIISILGRFDSNDEIIMPSYTFVSSANPFVLRGAKPVFVDISIKDMNIDPDLIENAITSKTKAILVVHYGGVSCDMKMITKIAKRHNLILIEDAAQAINAFYDNKPLGTLGDYGALSFHNTKNISSGEGGLLTSRNFKDYERSLIIHEKGTNRHDFISGKVSKYAWKDIGSSYILNDISCALLYSQLRNLNKITEYRLKVWDFYNLICSEHKLHNDCFYLQSVKSKNKHNGHLFYLLFNSKDLADNFNKMMKEDGIQTCKHYVALHDSPYGKKVSRSNGNMDVTNMASNNLIRIPIWEGINYEYIGNLVKKNLDRL